MEHPATDVPAEPRRPAVSARAGVVRPVDMEDLIVVRDLVQRLVALDVRFGGGHISEIALRALRNARRVLRARSYRKGVQREFEAAVAELAELTGWLLCDANRHGLADRVNRYALSLAHKSGDRSMALFVTHNMALQATYLRWPERTLRLVEPVLDRGVLTPRLEAMFRLRDARAMAQLGARRQAMRAFDRALSSLYDGPSDRDPAWAWWISERGFRHASGAMHCSLGEWSLAIDLIHQAVEAVPPADRRSRFLYLCVLLQALAEAGAWREAEEAVRELVPLLGAVNSVRPLATLRSTLERVHLSGVPSGSAQDLIEHALISVVEAYDHAGLEAPVPVAVLDDPPDLANLFAERDQHLA
ncbi:hypothetical protein OHR68_20780 [Spirillospora sp. NBC_00431]